ncbi:MAG: hypothetical protein Q9M26_07570 [Mariprofundales bacterium]|nr:hypothetical protein [Mariprofundales bacterium]
MTDEAQARFEVLLERIEHSVTIIAEGHMGLVERIDRLETNLLNQIQVVEQRSEARDAALEARLTKEIRAVGDKVDSHEERIEYLERKCA